MDEFAIVTTIYIALQCLVHGKHTVNASFIIGYK